MGDASAQLHLYDRLTLRVATLDDLDDITRIVQAGFPDDPEVNYRFPLREQYPEDYLKWTRKEYEGYIKQPEKFVVHLIDASVESDGKVITKPAALAVWDIAVLTEDKNKDLGLDERRDVNKKHYEVYTEVVVRCFKKYFAKYEEKQIHLWLIVTHPDFRRRGAGTLLTNWGMKTGTEQGWLVTVFASPMDELLYSHLGFVKMATEFIQVDVEFS